MSHNISFTTLIYIQMRTWPCAILIKYIDQENYFNYFILNIAKYTPNIAPSRNTAIRIKINAGNVNESILV